MLYLLFLSGLLAGEIFPVFTPTAAPGEPSAFGGLFASGSAKAADYAKLFFWSFVAGYSERFVMDIIGRFEETAWKTREESTGSHLQQGKEGASLQPSNLPSEETKAGEETKGTKQKAESTD